MDLNVEFVAKQQLAQMPTKAGRLEGRGYFELGPDGAHIAGPSPPRLIHGLIAWTLGLLGMLAAIILLVAVGLDRYVGIKLLAVLAIVGGVLAGVGGQKLAELLFKPKWIEVKVDRGSVHLVGWTNLAWVLNIDAPTFKGQLHVKPDQAETSAAIKTLKPPGQ